MDSSWKQRKIDAKVAAPEFLSLTHAAAKGGLQPGEQAMQTDAAAAGGAGGGAVAAAVAVPDESLVEQLVSMGFSAHGCRRAVLATNNTNVDVRQSGSQSQSW